MEDFKDILLKTITLCNVELKNRKNGLNGESTIEQLEKIIIPELNKLLSIISNNQLPPKERRYLN